MRETAADAPGRVNLIGEHTDYHDGWVLPSAIPQRTAARLRERRDRHVHAVSAQRLAIRWCSRSGKKLGPGSWVDYVQGLTWALENARIRDRRVRSRALLARAGRQRPVVQRGT